MIAIYISFFFFHNTHLQNNKKLVEFYDNEIPLIFFPFVSILLSFSFFFF